MAMNGRIETLPNPAALARHVADWMTSAALAATGDFRGVRFPAARPRRHFSRCWLPIVHRALSVESGLVVLGDERFVPYDHPESNYRMTARRCWPRRLFHRPTFIRCGRRHP